MAEIIQGKPLAETLIARIKAEAEGLRKRHNLTPGLAVILVGDDSASAVYVAAKSRKAEECGFRSVSCKLPETASQDEVLRRIAELNRDKTIHGILVQLPLPAHLDKAAILQSVAAEKDVDGLNYVNIGKLVSGARDGFVPCTPAGIMLMLRPIHGEDLSGLDAVIIGSSDIVGKPMASLLLNANATTTIAHSRTRDLPEVVRSADILIAAAGQAEMVKGSWIKPGATVIDVGINRIAAPAGSGKETILAGDVEFDTASIIAGHITPVPGGVGPMTIAMLMANTLRAACLSAGETAPEFG